MKEQRLAWAITGAGHLLAECAERLLRYERVDVFLSRAAQEVTRMYRLEDRLQGPRVHVHRETLASSPAVVGFARGVYRVLVVAPATSNSVAKFVYGISDSLVSNLFTQAGKSRVPIVVLPTDLMLQQDMAETAVFGQHHSVFAHMLAVMAAETTRSMPMAPVVREISPAHLHYWIIISLVTSLKRRNCVLDGSLPLLCN